MGQFGLTMDTLLDELGLRYTSHISPALAAVRFQWPKLARGEEPEWGAEYLRVCLLSEALGRPRRESCCLCLRDRIADDAESDEAMAGLVRRLSSTAAASSPATSPWRRPFTATAPSPCRW